MFGYVVACRLIRVVEKLNERRSMNLLTATAFVERTLSVIIVLLDKLFYLIGVVKVGARLMSLQ